MSGWHNAGSLESIAVVWFWLWRKAAIVELHNAGSLESIASFSFALRKLRFSGWHNAGASVHRGCLVLALEEKLRFLELAQRRLESIAVVQFWLWRKRGIARSRTGHLCGR